MTSTSRRVRLPEPELLDSSVSGAAVGLSEGCATPPISTEPVTGLSTLPPGAVAVPRGRGEEEVRRGAGVAVRVAVDAGVGLGVTEGVGSSVSVGSAVGEAVWQPTTGGQGAGDAVGEGSAPAVPGVVRVSRGSATTAAPASSTRSREVVGTARW